MTMADPLCCCSFPVHLDPISIGLPQAWETFVSKTKCIETFNPHPAEVSHKEWDKLHELSQIRAAISELRSFIQYNITPHHLP